MTRPLGQSLSTENGWGRLPTTSRWQSNNARSLTPILLLRTLPPQLHLAACWSMISTVTVAVLPASNCPIFRLVKYVSFVFRKTARLKWFPRPFCLSGTTKHASDHVISIYATKYGKYLLVVVVENQIVNDCRLQPIFIFSVVFSDLQELDK